MSSKGLASTERGKEAIARLAVHRGAPPPKRFRGNALARPSAVGAIAISPEHARTGAVRGLWIHGDRIVRAVGASRVLIHQEEHCGRGVVGMGLDSYPGARMRMWLWLRSMQNQRCRSVSLPAEHG